ncbi:MAG: alpha/beta hydrolase, partial [Solimonas sp.]
LSGPRAEVAHPGCALVCHPHPLQGGAMSNKVTYTLASCAQKAGAYALRFNFRGVGRSAGPHDEGRGETGDVIFLAGWLRERLPDAPLLLAGFSFGAWVSSHAAARVDPVALVSIAPPFARYRALAPPPSSPHCPWLVVQGTDDEVVGYAETVQALKEFAPSPQLVTMDGVGHFFHNRLSDLADAVQPFMQAHLAG